MSTTSEPTPRGVSMRVAFLGSSFNGFQRQAEQLELAKPSVHAALQSASGMLFCSIAPIEVGCHVRDLLVWAFLPESSDPRSSQQFPLPTGLHLVDTSVQPFTDAPGPSLTSTQFSYYVQTGQHVSSLEPYCWFVAGSLDIQAMEQVLRSMVGEHGTSTWCKKPARSDTPVHILSASIEEISAEDVASVFSVNPETGRTLLPADTQRKPEQILRITMVYTCAGSTRNMERRLAWALCQVGQGKYSATLDGLKQCLREKEGMAPARGLWLDWVRAVDGVRVGRKTAKGEREYRNTKRVEREPSQGEKQEGARQPGHNGGHAHGHYLGNFANYYTHNPVEYRLQCLTPDVIDHILNILGKDDSPARPLRLLDIGKLSCPRPLPSHVRPHAHTIGNKKIREYEKEREGGKWNLKRKGKTAWGWDEESNPRGRSTLL